MAEPREIKIIGDYIALGQFLKLARIIDSGGAAKAFLAETLVLINGEADERRGRKLREGDEILILGKSYRITR